MEERYLDRCLSIIERQTQVIELLLQSSGNTSKAKIEHQELENEMKDLFINECEKRDFSKDKVSEVLEKGKKVGVEPSFTISGGSGKYFTNKDLEEVSNQKKNFKRLSRADELDIIHNFEYIVGKGYYESRELVEGEGYSLHPIYVNDEDKQEALLYSGSVLGVKVRDPCYSPSMKILSPQAVITEIVDVGGQDPHNRGEISL